MTILASARINANRKPNSGGKLTKAKPKRRRRRVGESTDTATFLKVLHPDGVFEVRIPNTYQQNPNFRKTSAGYFNVHAKAAESIRMESEFEPVGIYVTLNPVKPELLARTKNAMSFGIRSTTKDDEILSRRWILLDVDPVRLAGISSTNRERDAAIAKATEIRHSLRGLKWPNPITMMSGNGAYLIYRVDMPNDGPSTALVKDFIAAIASRFDDEEVKIDRAVFNAARIIKVAGTTARKGSPITDEPGMDDRPHRVSYFYPSRKPHQVVAVDLIEDFIAAHVEPKNLSKASPAKESLAKTKRTSETQTTPIDDVGDAAATVVERCRKYVANMPAAVAGGDGSGKTYQVACVIAEFGLSRQQAETLLGEYNSRCEPPWSKGELRHKLDDAYRHVNGQGKFGCRAVSGDTEELPSEKMPLKDATPEDVARAFVDSRRDQAKRLILRQWRQAVFTWRDGRYVEIKKADVKAELTRYLHQRYTGIKTLLVNDVLTNVYPMIEVDGAIDMPEYLGATDHPLRAWKLDDLYVGPETITHLPSYFGNQSDHSVANTPDYFTSTANHVDVPEVEQEPAAWLRFLEQIFGSDGESIGLLQQWMGYLITPATSQQKLMLILGPPRSGKGTIARVIESIVGRQNCCSPALSDLSSRFGLSGLLGKSVATIGDARLSSNNGTSRLVERILSITGEDSISVERKYQDILSTRLTSRFTVLSNELPRLDDASAVVATRFLILKTKTSFLGKEDRTLHDRLLEERDAILGWALYGWRSLHETGRFTQTEESQLAQREMMMIASPVLHFVEDVCRVESGLRIPKEALYQRYSHWCDSHGFGRYQRTEPMFGRDLCAAVDTIHDGRPRTKGKRTQTWFGIGVNR